MTHRGSAAAILIAVFLAVRPCAHSDTIDRNQLDEMRQSAESLMSRILNLQMDYVSDWKADQQSDAYLRATAGSLQKLEERLAAESNPKVRERLLAAIDQYRSGGSSIAYKLTYAYPSMRLDAKPRRKSREASLAPGNTLDTTWATNGNSFTGIDHRRSRASLQSRISNDNLNLFDHLPSEAIGLRAFLGPERPGSQPLVSLLSHPQITSIEGHESVDGVDTVILKVGPGMPVLERPGFMGREDYVKLWLARSHNYLAIRKEYHYLTIPARDKSTVESGIKPVDHRVDCITIKDFRPVLDLARGDTNTHLPFLITYKDPAGTTTWRVSSLTINNSLSQDEFKPAIPDGFTVSVDGSPHKKFLSGGLAEKKRIVDKSVTAVRALLLTSAPRAEGTFSSAQIGMAAAVVFFVSLVLFLIVRRRFGHAS